MTNKKLLYDAYEDSIFALAANEAAECYGKQLAEENERLQGKYALNARQQQRFNYKIAAALHKKRARQKLTKALPYAIAIVILLAILSYTPFGKAIAAQFKNLWIEIRQESTDYRFTTTQEGDDQLHNCYLPAYIPAGFSLTDNYILSEDSTTMIFLDETGEKVIEYTSSTSNGLALSVDSENAEIIEKILVNGYEGTLIAKEPFFHIVWTDKNCLFHVSTNISAEITKQIAESVEFKE